MKLGENEALTPSYLADEGFLNMFSLVWLDKEHVVRDFSDVFDAYSIEDVEFTSVELIVAQNYVFETNSSAKMDYTNDKRDTMSIWYANIYGFQKTGRRQLEIV